jgi:hypothetical protein
LFLLNTIPPPAPTHPFRELEQGITF